MAAGVDESSRIMKFGVSDGFDVELRRRVEAFFRATGRRQRDCWQIYVKTGILVAVGVASYLLLALGAWTWWQALPLAILLGLTAAGIGFNVQHDGGHRGLFDAVHGSTIGCDVWRVRPNVLFPWPNPQLQTVSRSSSVGRRGG